MDLYLVRHATAFDQDAEKWPDDRERPLTEKGAKGFRKAARGLRELVPQIDVLLSSGYVRAWTTAEISSKEAKWPKPVELAALEPERPPADVVKGLVEHAGVKAVALVGHEPSLSALLVYLVGGPKSSAKVVFEKGGAAYVQIDGELRPGAGTLQWLVTPKLLRQIS